VAKSVSAVADDLRDELFASEQNQRTFSWSEFPKACDRERLKDAFKEELRTELQNRSVAIAYGMSAVIVSKDYNFNPRRK
jgi:hypothetical protein